MSEREREAYEREMGRVLDPQEEPPREAKDLDEERLRLEWERGHIHTSYGSR